MSKHTRSIMSSVLQVLAPSFVEKILPAYVGRVVRVRANDSRGFGVQNRMAASENGGVEWWVDP